MLKGIGKKHRKKGDKYTKGITEVKKGGKA
jgi:hypothetical protein